MFITLAIISSWHLEWKYKLGIKEGYFTMKYQKLLKGLNDSKDEKL